MTVLEGGGKCPYAEGTTQAAEAFLQTHPTTVLVTVDLGFNDLLACLRHQAVDTPCVDASLATVHNQLAADSGRRQGGGTFRSPASSASATTTLTSVTISESPGGEAFALASLSVMERLDATLRSDYTAAGLPIADVASAFDLGDHRTRAWSGLPTVPTDVARTCELTWMCNGPPLGHNVHPDDAGYRAIASAIADAVAGSSNRGRGT